MWVREDVNLKIFHNKYTKCVTTHIKIWLMHYKLLSEF